MASLDELLEEAKTAHPKLDDYLTPLRESEEAWRATGGGPIDLAVRNLVSGSQDMAAGLYGALGSATGIPFLKDLGEEARYWSDTFQEQRIRPQLEESFGGQVIGGAAQSIPPMMGFAVNPAAGYALTAAQIYEGERDRAIEAQRQRQIQETGTFDPALLDIPMAEAQAAVATGPAALVEGAADRLTAGLAGRGLRMVDEALAGTPANVANLAIPLLGASAAGAGSEAVQSLSSDIIAQDVFKSEDADPMSERLSRAGQQAAVGAVIPGVLAGPPILAGTIANKLSSAQEAVSAGLPATADTLVQQAYQELDSGRAGEAITEPARERIVLNPTRSPNEATGVSTTEEQPTEPTAGKTLDELIAEVTEQPASPPDVAGIATTEEVINEPIAIESESDSVQEAPQETQEEAKILPKKETFYHVGDVDVPSIRGSSKSGGVGEFYITSQPDAWKDSLGREDAIVTEWEIDPELIATSTPSLSNLTAWALEFGYMEMAPVKKPDGSIVYDLDGETPLIRPIETEKGRNLPFYESKDPMRGGNQMKHILYAYLKDHGYAAYQSEYSPDGHEIAVFDLSSLTKKAESSQSEEIISQQPAVETAQPTTQNASQRPEEPEDTNAGTDLARQVQEDPGGIQAQEQQEVTEGGVIAPSPEPITDDAISQPITEESLLRNEGIQGEGELQTVGEGNAQEIPSQENIQEVVSRKLEPEAEFARLSTRGTGENPTPSEIDKIVARLGVPSADVQDVAQDVAIKAAQSYNPDGGTAPLTWANRVAQTTVADYFRRQGAQKRDAGSTISIDSPITEEITVGDTLPSEQFNASEQAEVDDAKSRVRDLLSDFPDVDRNVMLLAMEGMSNPEIAAELGMDPKAVSTIKTRSLKKLKSSPYLLGIASDNKIATWLDKNFSRLFKAEGDLPVDVFKRWQRREGSVRSESKQIKYASSDLYDAIRQEFGISKSQEFFDGMRQVPAEFVNRMNQALTGEIPISSLPVSIQGPIQSMRDHVDALSQRMIDEGIVPEELQAVIGDNMGVYLTRSYRMFDDPKWKDKITPEVRNKAINFILKEKQSIDPSYTMDQAVAEVEAMLEDWSGQGSGVVVKKGSKLGSKDLSSLIRRKDIPKEIRDLLGEYRNPVINYARSVSKMSALIENQKFLKDVRDIGMGKFLFEDGTQPSGFGALIAAEGSQVMSPLNGLRTTPEIASAFNEFGKSSPPPEGWWRAWLTLNAISKTAKTVGSFMTQARNILGQPVFWMMNGHWNPTEFRKAQKAVLGDLGKNDKNARELYRRYVNLGIVDQSTMASELRDAINDARLSDPNEDVFNQGVAATILKNLRKVTVGAAERAYQLSDDIGKIVGFENELSIQQKIHPDRPIGELEQIAAERVKNGYPTYSMVPEWVKKFRRQPFFGPFVTFSYEAYRTLIHNLRYASEDINSDNPAQRAAGYRRASGIIGALAGSYVLSGISRALLGISPEEERDARRFMAPWDKNSQLLFTNKEPGKLSFINLSYVNPYSGIADISIPLVSGIAGGQDVDRIAAEMFAESIQPFASEGIFTAKLLDVMRNQTEQGRRVYNPSDPDKYEKMTRHIADSLVPGTIDRAVKRIGPAFMGKTTTYGQSLNPAQEVISELTGFKQQTTDYIQALGYKAADFRDNDNDAEGIFRETVLNRGSVDPQDIVAAYTRSNATRFATWKAMYQDIQAARRRGVTDSQIQTALKSRNVTDRDSSLLLRGIYQPYRPSAQMMRSLREMKRALPPEVPQQIQATTGLPLNGEIE